MFFALHKTVISSVSIKTFLGPHHYYISTHSRICSTFTKLRTVLPMNVSDIRDCDSSSILKYAKDAASHLLEGCVIALPTDTLYGLAALAQNDDAITDIYKIKKRSLEKPLAICVSEVEDVYLWGKVTISDLLLKQLLPGPVTLIFERTPALNLNLNPDTSLVGIRIPDHEFVRSVVKECRSPLALTSANVNSEKSPLNVSEFEPLWEKLKVVYNGGELGQTALCRRGSTIVDLSIRGHFKVVRKGVAYSRTKKHLEDSGLKRMAL